MATGVLYTRIYSAVPLTIVLNPGDLSDKALLRLSILAQVHNYEMVDLVEVDAYQSVLVAV